MSESIQTPSASTAAAAVAVELELGVNTAAVRMQKAEQLAEKGDPKTATKILIDTITDKEVELRDRETACYKLLKLWVTTEDSCQFEPFLQIVINELSGPMPQARLTKLLRAIVNNFVDAGGKTEDQVQLCKCIIEWARNNNHIFQRQRMEQELAQLFLTSRQYKQCLEIGEKLADELKLLDAKRSLIDISLILSQAYIAISNFMRAKSTLMLARTTSDAIYCPPSLQTELDRISGILALYQKEYKSAYGYFSECLETLVSSGDLEKAQIALELVLLSKVLDPVSTGTPLPEEIDTMLTTKSAQKAFSTRAEALRELAQAVYNKDVDMFRRVRNKYSHDLSDEPIITNALDSLGDKLMDSHIIKSLAPFSRIGLGEVSQLTGVEPQKVRSKLSSMILRGQLAGFIDEMEHSLIMFDLEKEAAQNERDKRLEAAATMISKLREVVRELEVKAESLWNVTA